MSHKFSNEFSDKKFEELVEGLNVEIDDHVKAEFKQFFESGWNASLQWHKVPWWQGMYNKGKNS